MKKPPFRRVAFKKELEDVLQANSSNCLASSEFTSLLI